MNITDFIKKWNGVYVEVAGTSAKNQCIDLANLFIRDFLGQPIIEWANAVDFPSKAGDQYDYILNSPTGVPQEGDLVVWGGQYGHIAIFIEGDANRFTSFDENFPVGSPCHIQEHNYNTPLKVLGWLHFKGQLPTDDLIKQRADAFVAVASELNKPVDKDIIIADIKHFKDLEDMLRQSNQALDEANSKLIQIQQQAVDSQNKVDELTAKNMALQEALQRLTKESESQSVELVKLDAKVKELQEVQPISKISFSDLLKELFSRFRR